MVHSLANYVKSIENYVIWMKEARVFITSAQFRCILILYWICAFFLSFFFFLLFWPFFFWGDINPRFLSKIKKSSCRYQVKLGCWFQLGSSIWNVSWAETQHLAPLTFGSTLFWTRTRSARCYGGRSTSVYLTKVSNIIILL